MNKIVWQVISHMPKSTPGTLDNTMDALNMALSKVKYQYKKQGKSYDESKIKILNYGCGKGEENIWLLTNSKCQLTMIDNDEVLINDLDQKITKYNLSDRCEIILDDNDFTSCNELPFSKNSFDIIWTEGAVRFKDFDIIIKMFKKYLKPGGVIVISDYILKDLNMPLELKRYFEQFYPEINTIDNNIAIAENNGLKVNATFIVPDEAWWKYYLAPLREITRELNIEYQMDPDKRKIIEELTLDMTMRDKYKGYYDYAFYILQKK
ncbi:MAG: class I SAM-dependent methyltransferase [Clostridia bacterium]|nr:class I SAM-dependent methyltransferase [Clostridia bacterium]